MSKVAASVRARLKNHAERIAQPFEKGFLMRGALRRGQTH